MNATLETRIGFSVLVKSKCEERRCSSRVRTVFRIARASTDIDERLCRVQNISDEGMMFVTSLDVADGDRILITLSDEIVVGGEVIWRDGGRTGMRFEKPVDSAGILQMLAEEASTGAYRLPRLSTNLLGVARAEFGLRATKVLNISQRGMKVSHDGCFKLGLLVKVVLETGLERRGVVRWSQDGVAGLQLLEPLALQELDSVCTYGAVTDVAGEPYEMGKHASV